MPDGILNDLLTRVEALEKKMEKPDAYNVLYGTWRPLISRPLSGTQADGPQAR